MAGATQAPAATLKLERAVLLMRHGVRPPTHEPALDPAIAPSAWPVWDVPAGELTPRGAQAITLLGAYDRGWLAGQGLLPATGCPRPGAVTVYADVDERTVKTGQAYVAGLAPGCALMTTHAAGGSDPLFSPFDTGAVGFDTMAAQAEMRAAAGGSPQNLIAAHGALLRQMQDVLAPGGTAFLDLPSKISAKPGHPPKLFGPLAEGASAAEDFLLEYLDDKPMAEVGWGRVSAADVATLLALHPLQYTLTARPPAIADRAAAALAMRIGAMLSDGPAFTVLVGHDTNIAELGGMLGLHWSLGGYPADDPPPGGGILFALLKAPVGGAEYVTATYQVQTMAQIRALTPLAHGVAPALAALPIPGCGNATTPTACPLPAFLALIQKRAAVAPTRRG